MFLDQLKQHNIIKSDNTISSHYIKLLERHMLMTELVSNTSFLSDTASVRERLYALINNIDAPNICAADNCTNITKFHDDGRWRNTYRKFCSLKCSNNDSNVKQQKCDTVLSTHGVINPSQSEKVKKQKQLTSIQNWGTNHPLQSEEIKQRLTSSVEKTYGVSNIMQVDQVKAKNITSKNNSAWLISMKDKFHYRQLRVPGWLEYQHHDLQKSTPEIGKMLGTSSSTVIVALHDQGIEPKRFMGSAAQNELSDWIVGLGEQIQTDRFLFGISLDIVIPSKKIAIEYNGLFYHSTKHGTENRINQNFHLNKTNICEKYGYQLIHIFEDDWMLRPHIVKSRLRSVLGVIPTKMYARKCHIIAITSSEACTFLNDNHIQGNTYSTINYGLTFNSKLVAVMTFSKSRYTSIADWELVRYCSLCETSVVGGASKLFAYFITEHNPNSVVSYAARDWSMGSMYVALGFTFQSNTVPSLFYWEPKYNNLKRINRVSLQKHKLSNVLSNFDPKLTADENLANNGYRKFWNTGNKVYKWTKP